MIIRSINNQITLKIIIFSTITQFKTIIHVAKKDLAITHRVIRTYIYPYWGILRNRVGQDELDDE